MQEVHICTVVSATAKTVKFLDGSTKTLTKKAEAATAIADGDDVLVAYDPISPNEITVIDVIVDA